jgi:hypothetical protein
VSCWILAIGVVECSLSMARLKGAVRDLIQGVPVHNQQELHLRQDLYFCILVVSDDITMLRKIFHTQMRDVPFSRAGAESNGFGILDCFPCAI